MLFAPGQLVLASSINKITGNLDLCRRFSLGHESQRFTVEWVYERSRDVDIETYRRIVPGNIHSMQMHGFGSRLKDRANLIHPDPAARIYARERYLQAIEVAGALGAEHIIFHDWYSPKGIKDFTEDLWLGQAERWPELAERAREVGVMIVLENVRTPAPELMLKLLERIGHPNVQAHLDVPHAHVSSKVPLADWIRVLGGRLHYLHIHNVDEGRGHQPLHRGELDYTRLFPLLEPVWKQVRVSLEFDIDVREDVDGSLQLLQDMGLLRES